MDRQIVMAMLTQSITCEPYIKPDGRGKPSYGTSKALTCAILGMLKMVRNMEGEEVISRETLYFNADADSLAITCHDRITLPDGRQPPIISVQPFYGEKGCMNMVEVNV